MESVAFGQQVCCQIVPAHKVSSFQGKTAYHFIKEEYHRNPCRLSMMTKSSVLLVGATGETGKHILEALIEDRSFVGVFLSSDQQKGRF